MRWSFQRLAMVWMIAACRAAFADGQGHAAVLQERGGSAAGPPPGEQKP